MLASLRSNGIPLLKVVTGWGYAWDAASRHSVCTTMAEVLIRTVAGDGCASPPQLLTPDAVLFELQPWYDARPDVWIELGNEPNGYDPSDDAAWSFRYWFLETLAAVRSACPQARIVTPGLIAERQGVWWQICQDAFEQADAIGWHAYAHQDFDDSGQIAQALDELTTCYPAHDWILTECGINDPATAPEIKAERYSALHEALPGQVRAVCWYHACANPIDADQKAYQITPEALPYLTAGGF